MPNVKIEKLIVKLYEKEKLSFKQIADILQDKFPKDNYYPVKISRILKKLNIKTRNKSEAQKEILKSGVKKHPTKGRKRTEQERENISKGQDKFWSELDEIEKENKIKEFADRAKKHWMSLTSEEQFDIISKMNKGANITKKEGSKLEKALMDELDSRGYTVRNRVKIEAGKNTEIDILMEPNFAIEVDGPTHFMPIYGEETLMKTVNKDEEKNKLIRGAGFYLCRIRNKKSKITKRLLNNIIKGLEEWRKGKNKFFEINTEDF